MCCGCNESNNRWDLGRSNERVATPSSHLHIPFYYLYIGVTSLRMDSYLNPIPIHSSLLCLLSHPFSGTSLNSSFISKPNFSFLSNLFQLHILMRYQNLYVLQPLSFSCFIYPFSALLQFQYLALISLLLCWIFFFPFSQFVKVAFFLGTKKREPEQVSNFHTLPSFYCIFFNLVALVWCVVCGSSNLCRLAFFFPNPVSVSLPGSFLKNSNLHELRIS